MRTEILPTIPAKRTEDKGRFEEPKAESLGGFQEWDVDADAISEKPKGKMMSDDAAKKLSEVAENPSDDALLHRADATFLEEGDNPNEGYDPHNVGYSKDKMTRKMTQSNVNPHR